MGGGGGPAVGGGLGKGRGGGLRGGAGGVEVYMFFFFVFVFGVFGGGGGGGVGTVVWEGIGNVQCRGVKGRDGTCRVNHVLGMLHTPTTLHSHLGV